VIAFLERLRTPSGKHASRPLRLRKWQKKLIRDVYDNVDERGLRIVQSVLWTMAKKNGKTALIAGLVLVHLCGPEAIPEAEIYSAANSRTQAALIFKACKQMIEHDKFAPRPLKLAEKLKVVASKSRIVCLALGSFYQSLSADGDTAEGISPTVWIYDELGRTKKTALYESLANAEGAWEEPLGFIISVQAVSPNMIMSKLVKFARELIAGTKIDPTWSVAVFEVPEDADPFDESVWALANPGIVEEIDEETGEILPAFKQIASIRKAANRARENPSQMAPFLNLQLNQQVDAITAHIHLKEDWEACAHEVDEEALRGATCFGGLDLSRRFDLSALGLVFEERACAHCGSLVKPIIVRAWTPSHRLAERAEQDDAPYAQWIADGHLIEVPGKAITYDFVAKEIAAMRAKYDLREIGYDPWRFPEVEEALLNQGVDFWVANSDGKPRDGDSAVDENALRLQSFVQGPKTFNPAIEGMEEDVLEHRLAHGNHPVLYWCASNAVTRVDANLNRALDKKAARSRIDVYVAVTMANGISRRYSAREPDEIEQGLVIV